MNIGKSDAKKDLQQFVNKLREQYRQQLAGDPELLARREEILDGMLEEVIPKLESFQKRSSEALEAVEKLKKYLLN
ncbi:hypothetical protein [Oecophyllibacter saccharovorans]|uniref:hypothetical protein n=1 Tax=Oecophyllibacter saccharovorans TaxID=2558360 RepID=UPI001171044C|nr:hypothetical protein [Oecophyllibacter saccharovorans]TPW36604.1 hypothetical protein E3203_02240 [Oecophyllibacter saccharovorans]